MDLKYKGYLSGDEGVNPGFYNWTRIYVPYCDGAGHQGSRSFPINYRNVNLYFRGQNNTI